MIMYKAFTLYIFYSDMESEMVDGNQSSADDVGADVEPHKGDFSPKTDWFVVWIMP